MLYNQYNYTLLKKIIVYREIERTMKHHKPWIMAALNLLLLYIFLIIEDTRRPQYSQYSKHFERYNVSLWFLAEMRHRDAPNNNKNYIAT